MHFVLALSMSARLMSLASLGNTVASLGNGQNGNTKQKRQGQKVLSKKWKKL
jgi:hypothetical protein